MKNKMMRLLSLLLALVLVAAGLIQGGAVEAEAAGDLTFNYAYDCQRNPAYPQKLSSANVYSFIKPYDGNMNFFAENKGDWKLVYNCQYKDYVNPSTNMASVATSVKNAYGMGSTDTLEVYTLYNGSTKVIDGFIYAQTASFTLFVGTQRSGGGIGYLLSVSDLTENSYTETVTKDATTGNFHQNTEVPNTPTHTHAWKIDATGNGTKEAKATVCCTADGCEEQTYEVKFTASDVTLPGEVLNAGYTISPVTGRSVLPFTVSQTPGYKYSADGTNYVAVDPATFEAKQGYYQASIMVNAGTSEANLYVHYTVSDPVVTAATGDDRPIGMMFAGMAAFAAMAAVAFTLDSKRRVRF